MTREELSNKYFIFTKINEQNQEEITAIIDGSLLIPKPKFKVDDKVQVVNRDVSWQFIIYQRYFDPDEGIWIYEDGHYSPFDESELELVEAAE